MREKYLVKALVEVKYFVWGENETEEIIKSLEEGELELMLGEDNADITYVDNQSCRFKEVDVKEIKVTKIQRMKKCRLLGAK
ncbi:MAG TPA: hypothetical protein VMW25_02125 [Clostridia bacterium]|nr:hypothetical protein [Clostridia bacterium]